jgi:hypothetical protein
MTTHMADHATALEYGHVVQKTCTTFGMFLHLGLGWEIYWLSVLAIHSYIVVREGSLGRVYKPSRKLIRGVTIVGWGAPIIWYTVIGLSVNAYGSTGYFCWIKESPVCILYNDSFKDNDPKTMPLSSSLHRLYFASLWLQYSIQNWYCFFGACRMTQRLKSWEPPIRPLEDK